MKIKISDIFFEKYSNIKFHVNPCRVIPYGRRDGQTDMTNLIVALRTFGKHVRKTYHVLCEVRGVGNNL